MVTTYNPYDMEYFGPDGGPGSAVEVFAWLKTWQSQHAEREAAFRGVFTRLFGLDQVLPSVLEERDLWEARVVRCPSAGIHHADHYRDIRLVQVHAAVQDQRPLLLWATVMLQNGCPAIVMHERQFEDDSGLRPEKSTVKLSVPCPAGRSDEDIRADLVTALGRLFRHYMMARALMLSTIVHKTDNGAWIPYDRKESASDKETRRRLQGDAAPTEYMLYSWWHEVYLCEPYSDSLMARYDTEDWGLYMRRPTQQHAKPPNTLAKSPDQVENMLRRALKKRA